MKGRFRDYNAAYATALNEQMLLNLARLDNGHPAYYLAIGTINEKVTTSAEASAGTTSSITDSDTSTTVQQASGGILNTVSRTIVAISSTIFGPSVLTRMSRTSAPEFQFIPLNNEAIAKQVLQPIPTDVFSTLYLQGYPIDQLMRVLIERIETTLPNSQEVVLVNSPTRGTPESYARFLRTCAILRELQRKGELLFDTRADFDTTANDARTTPRPPVPTFYLIPDRASDLLGELKREQAFDSETLTNVVELLRAGLSIKTDIGNKGQARTRLVLRSFDRAMEAVASEQAPFDLLLQKADFVERVPLVERRPVLRTVWPEKTSLAPPVEKLDYSGRTYQITDPIVSPLDPASRWNRDVFRLLVALGSQVTVDISKFQRQVLQLQQ
jgi:hypothetical protein